MNFKLIAFIKYLFRNWDFQELYVGFAGLCIMTGVVSLIMSLLVLHTTPVVGPFLCILGGSMIAIGLIKVAIISPLRESYANFLEDHNAKQEKLLEQIRTGRK